MARSGPTVLLILSVLLPAGGAGAEAKFTRDSKPPHVRPGHVIVDLRRVQRDLDPLNTAFAAEEKWINPRVKYTVGNLSVSGYNRDSDLTAAREITAALRAEPGSLRLLGHIDGQMAPAFNGLWTADDGRIEFNVKVLSVTHANGLQSLIENNLVKIDRYGANDQPVLTFGEPWSAYLMSLSRQIAGFGRRQRGANTLSLDPTRLEHYQHAVVITRRLMQIFAAGSRRPAKLMIAVHENILLNRTFDRDVGRLLDQHPRTTEIIITQAGRPVRRIQGSGVHARPLADCPGLFTE